MRYETYVTVMHNSGRSHEIMDRKSYERAQLILKQERVKRS